MLKSPLRVFAYLALSMSMIGCSAATNAGPMDDKATITDRNVQPTDYISVNYTETGTPESCLIDSYISVDKSVDIYMLEYDRYINGQKSAVPGQIKFSSRDDLKVRRERGGSGIFDQAGCQTYEVEWRNLECINQDREPMTCPEVKFSGPHSFKSLSVVAD